MSERFELLAPGGDLESIKAAIVAGADAVYCGLDKFNARNRAANLDWETLMGVTRLAHRHGSKIFLTLNIAMLQSEFRQLWKLLQRIERSDLDGVIVQDLGLFGLIKRHFPQLDLHASTQNNTHNWGQIAFLEQFGISRVNLSRELSLAEIKPLAQYGAERNIQMEVFVHGSYCVGFSGLCYLSSHHNGASGNRGRCSQPCRDAYQTTEVGLDYPLNMKDNNAFADIDALAEAGVYSLKVEGRIKKSHYVYSVVDQWRQQIDAYQSDGSVAKHSELLHTVYNRDFSAGYLHGDINRSMFIDNPRDHSANYFAKQAGIEVSDDAQFKALKRRLYDVKTDIIQHVESVTASLDCDKIPLSLAFSGNHGEPLQVTLIKGQGATAEVWRYASKTTLTSAARYRLDQATIEPIFNPLNDDNHTIGAIQLNGLADELNLPFAELAQVREQMLDQLGVVRSDEERALPAPPKPQPMQRKRLAVLLSNPPSAALAAMDVDLYFALPEGLADQYDRLLDMFSLQPKLMPFFPAILIGKHFEAAARLLKQLRPQRLITNNSGVAQLAQQFGIEWIAGPQFNLTNGYAFESLQSLGCSGGFLSNELSRRQLKPIGAPEGMAIYFSLYHPQALLTSRQCLIRQSVACRKPRFTPGCLRRCDKVAELTTHKQGRYLIDKQIGEHNVIYAAENYLNLDAIADLPQISHGFVDLRSVKTETRVSLDVETLVQQFVDALNGGADVGQVHNVIEPTNMKQYHKGI